MEEVPQRRNAADQAENGSAACGQGEARSLPDFPTTVLQPGTLISLRRDAYTALLGDLLADGWSGRGRALNNGGRDPLDPFQGKRLRFGEPINLDLGVGVRALSWWRGST